MSVIITVFEDCAFEPTYFGTNSSVIGMLRITGERIPFSRKLDYTLESYPVSWNNAELKSFFLIANSPKIPLVLAFAFDRADEWFDLYVKAKEKISKEGMYDPYEFFGDLSEHNERIGTVLHTYREKVGNPDYEIFLADLEQGSRSTNLILVRFTKPKRR